jgi:hypothetical protein
MDLETRRQRRWQRYVDLLNSQHESGEHLVRAHADCNACVASGAVAREVREGIARATVWVAKHYTSDGRRRA